MRTIIKNEFKIFKNEDKENQPLTASITPIPMPFYIKVFGVEYTIKEWLIFLYAHKLPTVKSISYFKRKEPYLFEVRATVAPGNYLLMYDGNNVTHYIGAVKIYEKPYKECEEFMELAKEQGFQID